MQFQAEQSRVDKSWSTSERAKDRALQIALQRERIAAMSLDGDPANGQDPPQGIFGNTGRAIKEIVPYEFEYTPETRSSTGRALERIGSRPGGFL